MKLLKRSLYEPIGAKNRHHPIWWGLLLVVFVFLLGTMKCKQIWISFLPPVAEHYEMNPTLLSIRDPHHITTTMTTTATSSSYVNALDNPLYLSIEQSGILDEGNSSIATIDFEEKEETLSSPSGDTTDCERVTWTIHNDGAFRSLDVLVIYKDDVTKIENVLEAATLEQLWYTYGSNPVYIPHVPRVLWRYNPQLAVVRKRGRHYHVIAKTTKKTVGRKFHRKTQPYNVHLAYTENPDEYVVRFTTAVPGTPVVRIKDEIYKRGSSSTYQNTDMCSAPANETKPGRFVDPGYLHEVYLDGAAGKKEALVYQVGLETGQGVSWSEGSYSVQPKRGELSYVIFGDQGCPNVEGAWEVGKSWMEAMMKRERTMQSVHHVGDLSYAKGAGHQWELWLDMIEPVSSHVPWMIAVGNHEYDYFDGASRDPSGAQPYHPLWGNFLTDSGGECGVPTSKLFTMPKPGNGCFWYSYVENLVQFIVLSSEHDLGHGSVQQEWLLETLSSVDRNKTPWLIVEIHRPLYEPEKFWAQESVAVALRYEIEDILFQHKVDMVFAGHYHAYHRSCDGLYRSKCNRGGPTHMTIGTAGARLDPANVGLMRVPWSEQIILETYGYGRVTVPNATDLHFDFIRMGNATDADAGEVLDEVWVHRDR